MRLTINSRMMRYLVACFCAMILCAGAYAASAQKVYLNGVDLSDAKLTNWTLDRVDSVEFDKKGNVHIHAPAYNVQVVPSADSNDDEHGASNRRSQRTPHAYNGSPSGSTSGHQNTQNNQHNSGDSNRTRNRDNPQQPSGRSSSTQSEQSGPIEIHYKPKVTMAYRYILALANPDRGDVPFDVDVLINGKHVATFTYGRGSTAQDVSNYIRKGNNVVSFVAHRSSHAKNARPGHEMRVLLGVGSYNGKVARYEHILVGMKYKSGDRRNNMRNTQNFNVEQ